MELIKLYRTNLELKTNYTGEDDIFSCNLYI